MQDTDITGATKPSLVLVLFVCFVFLSDNHFLILLSIDILSLNSFCTLYISVVAGFELYQKGLALC